MRAQFVKPLIAAAGLAVLAVPAAAQSVYVDDGPYVDEVVVPGVRLGPHGPDRLSQAVSFRDLDLTSYEGRRVLDLRIRATARTLCRALGEGSGNGGPLLPSCEEQARRDVRPQVRVAVNQAYASRAYAYLDTGAPPYPY